MAKEFNDSAFINCYHYKTFDGVIEKIHHFKDYPEEEFTMIQSPIFTNAQRKVQKQLKRDLEEFLFYICSLRKRNSYRINSLGRG